MTVPVVQLPIDGGENADLAAQAEKVKEQAKGLADILSAGMKRENIDQPPPPEVPAAAAAVEAPVVQEPISDAEMTEVESLLSEMGIDLGIRAADVTPELRPAYEALVQSAVALAEDTMRRQLEASESSMQFNQFKESVEKSPDRLLLSLAMSHPQLVSQTAELVNQMTTNPEVKAAVLRELEVELKFQEANRKEILLNEREKRMKAQQVISATRRAAREHGVDYDMAEKFVAMTVQANGGDLNPNEVSEIVQGLKPKTVSARPKVISPAQVTAIKTAPTTSVAAAQSTTPGSLSPGLRDGERKHSGGGFRSIVKEAMARVTGSGQ